MPLPTNDLSDRILPRLSVRLRCMAERLTGGRIGAVGCCWLLFLLTFTAGCPSRTPPAKPSATTKPLKLDANEADKSTAASQSAETAQSPAPMTEPLEGSVTTAAQVDSAAQVQVVDDSGEWSRQRFVALARSGPIVIELAVSLDGERLESASQRLIQSAAAKALEGLEAPVTWDTLLEQPLIQSQWLGNLLPGDDDYDQLMNLYDTGQDGIVTAEELGPFFTRGLSRRDDLQISDVGASSEGSGLRSPWGRADTDEDYSLSRSEAETFRRSAQPLDSNGDSVVTRTELQRSSNPAEGAMMTRGSSMLDSGTMLVFPIADQALNAQQPNTRATTDGRLQAEPSTELARSAATRSASTGYDRDLQRAATKLLQHYTFLGEVSPELWPGWSSERWQAVDVDQSGSVDKYELQRLADVPADIELYVRLPGLAPTNPAPTNPANPEPTAGEAMRSAKPEQPVQQAAAIRVQARLLSPDLPTSSTTPAITTPAIAPPGRLAWLQKNSASGAVVGEAVNLRIEVDDTFAPDVKQRLAVQLRNALGNAQYRAFLTNQLQLGEKAWEVLDADGDEQLSELELERAWRWLQVRQGTRLLARWMTAADPWFQLLDRDADDRLSELELRFPPEDFDRLDRDQDGLVTPAELPLLVKLELRRSDPRLDSLSDATAAGGDIDEGEVDWFTATDVNRDGLLSREEFLGDRSDFEALDRDKDAFVSRQEVYDAN